MTGILSILSMLSILSILSILTILFNSVNTVDTVSTVNTVNADITVNSVNTVNNVDLPSGSMSQILLGAFAKVRKAAISFVMSVCPCVRLHGTTRLQLDRFS